MLHTRYNFTITRIIFQMTKLLFKLSIEALFYMKEFYINEQDLCSTDTSTYTPVQVTAACKF